MKKKLLILLAELFVFTPLSSCKKDKVFYNITSFSNYKIIGENKVEQNQEYKFKVDYPFSYQNNDLLVFVNDELIHRNNGYYVVNNVSSDLLITVQEVKKENYSFNINNNPDLFEFFSSSYVDKINAGDSYNFGIKFWGNYDLSNIKVTIDDEIIYPVNFNGSYSEGTNYYFELKNINKDITINIVDYNKQTWYTYDLGDKKYYEHEVYANIDIDTFRPGYKFLGWSLEKENKDKIVSFPYKNNTNNDEVTLYPIYVLDSTAIDIPLIRISTNTSNITLDNYTTASFQFIDKSKQFTRECQIKIRGNSTSTYEKKPYKLRFNKGISLFGSEKYKNWVLLADYLDPSLIRNYTALSLENNSNYLSFHHTIKHVEVEIDGVYQGVYLLTDQVETNPSGRVNIEVTNLGSEQVPFLLERDKDGEGIYGVNYFTIGITNYIIKYPENPTQKQFNYIYNYISSLYENITEGNLNEIRSCLNLNSLYEYVLINELMVNIDSNWKSGYIYKSLTGKIEFGPVWDFDWCFSKWSSHPSVDQEFELLDKFFLLKRDEKDFSFDWMIYLIQHQEIYQELINVWNSFESNYNKTLNDIKNYYSYIKNAGLRNYNKWYKEKYQEGGSMNYHPIDSLFVDQYNFVISSLEKRYKYLDSLLISDNHKEFINEDFK